MPYLLDLYSIGVRSQGDFLHAWCLRGRQAFYWLSHAFSGFYFVFKLWLGGEWSVSKLNYADSLKGSASDLTSPLL